MKSQLHISWDCGPHSLKEEFDKMSSLFSKNGVDTAKLSKMSKRQFLDFIPDELFVTSNVANFSENDVLQKMDRIFEFVTKNTFDVSIDFYDLCDSVLDIKCFIVVQAFFVEILYNNHNVDIMLSKQTTKYVYELLCSYFDIDIKQLRNMLKKTLVAMNHENCTLGSCCISKYHIKEDVCYIELCSKQTLCRHSVLY